MQVGAPAAAIGDTQAMPVSPHGFLEDLLREVPEAEVVVEDHLAYYDELLLHLLVADIRRLAIAMFERGQSEPLARLLRLLDRSLTEGDDPVENAVAVSFVEDTGWWNPEVSAFMDAWPAGLAAEAERQRQRRPNAGAT